MKILLKLRVCQLKQRTDLWYRNTSFFSKQKKETLFLQMNLLFRILYCIRTFGKIQHVVEKDVKMHWSIARGRYSVRSIYLQQWGHVLQQDGSGPLFVLFGYCVVFLRPFQLLFPPCQRAPCELQDEKHTEVSWNRNFQIYHIIMMHKTSENSKNVQAVTLSSSHTKNFYFTFTLDKKKKKHPSANMRKQKPFTFRLFWWKMP